MNEEPKNVVVTVYEDESMNPKTKRNKWAPLWAKFRGADYVMIALIISALAMIWCTVSVSVDHSMKKEKLIEECIADGRKRYECEALLKEETRNTSIILMR